MTSDSKEVVIELAGLVALHHTGKAGFDRLIARSCSPHNSARELSLNVRNHRFGRTARVDHDRMAGFLETCDLTGQQLLGGEVAMTRVEALVNDARIGFEVNKLNFRSNPQDLAVTPLQSRARKHSIP